MANPNKAVPENVPGDFYVDSTCIDCDACRQIAPAVFGEGPDTSYVRSQPGTESERRRALYALLACPTGSIGSRRRFEAADVAGDFPLPVDGPVFYCGFNSPKSYGGNSYLIRHPEGNWLVDAPKFVAPLVRRLEALGGVRTIFLTHRDDVADAAAFASHFGARRILDRRELAAQPGAEVVLDGNEPTRLADDFLAIPTPGHTAGHLCLLHGRYLFTGDHLAWNRDEQRLTAHEDYCWHSWPEQVASLRRLLAYDFEWVLPGHGQRVHLDARVMRERLLDILE